MHSRSCKKDRVNRKAKANGSSLIRSVFRTISLPVHSMTSLSCCRRRAAKVWHSTTQFTRKLENCSFANVSIEDKKVMASAGAEFKKSGNNTFNKDTIKYWHAAKN